MSDPTDDAGSEQALQTALAAEHAAVFVYGALGARTSRSAAPARYAALVRAHDAHRDRRDELVALLERRGVVPVAAAPGYALGALDDDAAVLARARRLERDTAATYAYVVASTSGALRRWAVAVLLDAAVRGLDFGDRPERLPGL